MFLPCLISLDNYYNDCFLKNEMIKSWLNPISLRHRLEILFSFFCMSQIQIIQQAPAFSSSISQIGQY